MPNVDDICLEFAYFMPLLLAVAMQLVGKVGININLNGGEIDTWTEVPGRRTCPVVGCPDNRMFICIGQCNVHGPVSNSNGT